MKNIKFIFVIFILIFVMTSSALAGSKSDFLYLYKSDWNRDNLSYKLLRTIEKIFSENTIGSSSVSFRIGLNKDNIVEKIQQDVFNEFNDDYEKFLQRFVNKLPENHLQMKYEAEKDFIENTWPELRSKLLNPFHAVNWFIAGFMIFVVRAVVIKFLGRFKNIVRPAKIILGTVGIIVLILCIAMIFVIVHNDKLNNFWCI